MSTDPVCGMEVYGEHGPSENATYYFCSRARWEHFRMSEIKEDWTTLKVSSRTPYRRGETYDRIEFSEDYV